MVRHEVVKILGELELRTTVTFGSGQWVRKTALAQDSEVSTVMLVMNAHEEALRVQIGRDALRSAEHAG